MESAHQHAPDDHDSTAHHDDWSDEEYVARWLERQKERAPERRRQFLALRTCIPKNPDQEFRYLNLGAGPGNLDAVLLDHFRGASAVVLDGSLAMLTVARKELARFGDRVEYVQADLTGADWTGAVAGPFNFIVSARSVHHLGAPRRIRELYREAYSLLGHGGMFLNLDYVRPVKAELTRLADWAARDGEAAFSARCGHEDIPGTLTEQLGWLSEAGFGTVDVFWKEMSLALICGINGHLHMPWGHGDDPDPAQTHGHAH